MAKNKIEIDVKADDKGSLKKVGVSSKKAAKGLDETGKAAATADRNLKGAAQTSANGTKNFSKMSQGVGGLVGAYATLAAQVFAVSAAFQFLKSASEITNLIAGQEALGAVTGVAYKTITASIRDATDGQLSYAEAAKAAAIGTAAGLSPTQLDKLGTAAKNVSNALGRDLTDSFNRLVRGITKAEPELLDELGIILRLDTASKDYADAMGIVGRELTVFEKSQAVANTVLTQAEEKFGAIEKIMDPSAASLNKFLNSFDSLLNTFKGAAMDTLRPVFEFLSENTGALTAALALFAIPIVKSILPAFDEWERKAGEKLGKQVTALEAYQEELRETREEIMMLGQSESDITKNAASSTKSVFSDLGMETTGKKGGDKGTDFLLGTSDTKRSQANAKRILESAQNQMERHGKIMTGKLQGASKQQLAILQRNFKARSRLLKGLEVKSNITFKSMTLHAQSFATKAKIAMGSIQSYATKWSKKMSKLTSSAFAIAGWIGAIMLVFEGFKALINAMFPISDEVKRMREEIEAFTSSAETLNKELNKMAEVRPLLGTIEGVKQVGKALTSADINNKFAEFSRLDESEKGFDAAKKGMQGTFDALAKLNPAMTVFAEEFRNTGKLTDDSKAGMKVLTDAYQSAQVSADALKQSTKSLNDELKNLIGTGLTVDPTINYRGALQAQIANLEGVLSGIQLLLPVVQQGVVDAQAAADAAQEAASKQYGALSGSLTPGLNQDEADEANEQAQKALKLAQAQLKNRLDTEKRYSLLLEGNQIQLKTFQDASDKLNQSFESRLLLEEESSNLKTNGITLADRDSNLQSKALSIAAEHLKVVDKEQLARTNLTAVEARLAKLQGDKSDAAIKLRAETNAERAAADAALKAAEKNTRVSEKNLLLKNQSLGNEIIALDVLKQQVPIERDISNLKLASSNREIAFEQKMAQFAGSSLERARLERDNKKQTLLENSAIAVKELEIAGIALQSAENLSEEERQRRVQAAQAAAEKLAALTEELRLEGEIANIANRKQESANKDLQGRIDRLSLDPRKQAGNEAAYERKLDGGNEAQVARARQLAEAQFDLNLELEQTQGLYNTINNSMASAFEGMITGAKSAKEAFADMAKAILADLAKMIAKQMALQAIASASSFFGFKEGGITPEFAGGGISPMKGKRYTTGGIARGPVHGYNAVLHGNEAVVPLPSGGKIPVEFPQQATAPIGQQQNNVSVTVNMDGNTSDSETRADSNMGENLGNMVAKAVQEELQYQKRSGGILNPYGAA